MNFHLVICRHQCTYGRKEKIIFKNPGKKLWVSILTYLFQGLGAGIQNGQFLSKLECSRI
jgi:hypothetical protein